MKWELRVHSEGGPVVATSYDGKNFVSKKEGTLLAQVVGDTLRTVDGTSGRIDRSIVY